MRLFVTVGSMLPFDRLIEAVDRWAQAHPQALVRAQTGGGRYQPQRMRFEAMLPPAAYRQACAEADLIVSHAGMGTVITAAELGKPLLVLPRRRDLGEVTSDHQQATARWLRERPGLTLVEDAADLGLGIASALQDGSRMAMLARGEQDRLVATVRSFLAQALRR